MLPAATLPLRREAEGGPSRDGGDLLVDAVRMVAERALDAGHTLPGVPDADHVVLGAGFVRWFKSSRLQAARSAASVPFGGLAFTGLAPPAPGEMDWSRLDFREGKRIQAGLRAVGGKQGRHLGQGGKRCQVGAIAIVLPGGPWFLGFGGDSLVAGSPFRWLGDAARRIALWDAETFLQRGGSVREVVVRPGGQDGSRASGGGGFTERRMEAIARANHDFRGREEHAEVGQLRQTQGVSRVEYVGVHARSPRRVARHTHPFLPPFLPVPAPSNGHFGQGIRTIVEEEAEGHVRGLALRDEILETRVQLLDV